MSGKSAALACPSAQPDMDGAQVLGVMEQGPDGPSLAYVNGSVPVTEALLDATGEVPPTLVYRFSAPCAEKKCHHFDGESCQLVSRIVESLSPKVAKLPACAIRKTCRWYAQEAGAACGRCPQVVTRMVEPDPEMMRIAGIPA